MKNRFILLALVVQLASCDVFRPASRADGLTSGGTVMTSQKSQPVFIQDISIENRETGSKPAEVPLYRNTSDKTTIPNFGNEGNYDPLQFKYAILTNSPVEQLNNPRLLLFMDQWYGVPYHYGGKGKDGIDCSAFTCQLVSEVYNVKQLPRISADQYKVTRRISKKDLREGDLVFFHTLGKGHKVTHVGVYLYNNRFVHASVSGVQISDLGEGYYMHHYVGAGRLAEE
jgi:lipoprotein Spr